ncbi:MAG TPA: ribonuclease D [Smithellaceae bacterium]|nr:ribonuclease D [Smithellaceae bacterium]HRS89995.1 ribonuclease D [Smithellaceae bacterium]HRV26044.1 ribonuclease D [Smithellaceae bacterium]
MKAKWILVDSPSRLKRAAEDIRKSLVLGIDTEYDSFRYFREKLCLIQIHAGDTTYIFDPLADFDLSFLGEVFRQRQKIKVLHAADNDIRLLRRDYSFDFENIFDTHRAALMLGFKQLSLEKMIAEFVGVNLAKNKKMQRSRWDNRPLLEDQLSYAAQDVAYLAGLYERQLAQLKEKNLEEAAAEAFARIAASDWQEKSMDRLGHTKIKGYRDLNAQQKALLKKLYAWRWRRAKEENRAIFMFLPDNVLLELARGINSLNEILPPEKKQSYGSELAKIISAHAAI